MYFISSDYFETSCYLEILFQIDVNFFPQNQINFYLSLKNSLFYEKRNVNYIFSLKRKLIK